MKKSMHITMAEGVSKADSILHYRHQNHSDTPLNSGNIRSRGFRNKDRIVDTF